MGSGQQATFLVIDRYNFIAPTMEGQLPEKDLDAIAHRAYRQVYLGLRSLRSLFTQRTNLHRLRRTALGVFWAWIGFLIRERTSSWFGREQVKHPPPSGAG